MRIALSILLCLSLTFAWSKDGIKCPTDVDHSPAKTNRQTLETKIPNIVKLEFSCGRCTGFIIGKNKFLTASHCTAWPSLKIVAVFYDGRKSELKLVKAGDYINKPDEDIAILTGNSYGIEPMELAQGCPLPQQCGSFGYGQDGKQKAVRCYGGQPVPSSDGLWVFAGEIDHGDSGGPICNLNGDVLGMQVSMAREGKPIFFAVPSCKLLEFMK